MHGGRHVLSHRGVLTTEEWRDGYNETGNGAGVKNTELQISKSRIGEAPAPAFSNSVFSPLSFSGNAVGGRAASGKRRGRHCHYQTLPRCAMTSPAVVPLWSLYF